MPPAICYLFSIVIWCIKLWPTSLAVSFTLDSVVSVWIILIKSELKENLSL